ncbi:UDP-3-O-(3-hydroxymyristoyl)glucosamine N-acyltransferase [Dialister sp.]|uniref:UDP-3-O-(3-hydroxymyristoyl)glucosamine N-acyltransferase n=1 Tax=Dialister sp. TaxID=1955814 RepID=UPI002E816F2E|nr:UDP-3-O-(3-hydroxymyristoyl)glucosamine N-acyltransferase [Dialister sp.]MEE3452128.1 UDP-3-O-(3-hydroxymyristoyl)glucosamine N-acyltransferase [Dialister sp.]
MRKTAGELAQIVGGTLYGDESVLIDDVRSAESAGPSHVTFARGVYAEHIEEMQAGVILVDELPAHYTRNLIVVPDCRRSFGELVDFFHPENHVKPGIHPTAIVSDTAEIGKDVCIMAYSVIDDGVVIGDHTIIYPYTYIGKNAHIGEDCEINPGCVIHENTEIGSRVVLRAHAVIGGQGFGFSTDEQGHHHHIRQLGKAIIGDDCEIGAGSTIDNGALNDTVVGRGTKIDNLVHLGHNVQVGEDCFICAQTGVAGSTTIGSHCILAGQAGVNGHINITDNVVLGGKAGVIGSIKEPGVYIGYPARTHAQWGRVEVAVSHLPEMMKKLRLLEKKLAALEKE